MKTTPVAVPGEPVPVDSTTWPASHEQVQALFHRWEAASPTPWRLIREPSPNGRDVLFADLGAPHPDAPSLIVCQPHAQEPAVTPSTMEILSELITGQHLDGTPTILDTAAVLGAIHLTVNPLGNPDGRSRMPTACWTPGEWDRLEKRYWCNGKDRDGGPIMDARSKAMRLSEVDLDPRYPVGARLENCGGGLYADPRGWPGDLASNPTTLARALRRLLPERRYTLAVEMHQSDLPDHCYLILANPGDERTYAQLSAASAAVEDAWRAAGFPVGPRVEAPPPGFVRGIYQDGLGRPPVVCVEVGEGMSVTPPDRPFMTPSRQKEAGVIALHAILSHLLETGHP